MNVLLIEDDKRVANPSGCRERRFQLMQIDGTLAMVMCHDIKLDGMSLKLFQGGSLDEELDILRTYRNALLFLLPGLLILSSLCGYFLSRRAMDCRCASSQDHGNQRSGARLFVQNIFSLDD
jgi:hypothetical protein